MRMFKTIVSSVAVLTAMATSTVHAADRDQISIVGSSTVFPFSITVAERFGKTTDFKTPVVESTGSGGGLKLFCSGVGVDTPDITNASRKIKASEIELCAKNGVTEVVEAKVGYDGIVMANSVKGEVFALTLKDIFLALAKDVPTDEAGKTQPNPYKTWQEVNANLPAIKIEVLGPPPTSGTRDAFVELAMEGGCAKIDWVKALKSSDKDAYKALCHTIREDGAYIEAGENDNLIVKKLDANPKALGIFGYSFLEQNASSVQGATINGVAPEFELIASGDYPVSRGLWFYVKKAHVGVVPGIAEFLEEFTAEDTWGEEGYLIDKGLIPMTEGEAEEWYEKINGLATVK